MRGMTQVAVLRLNGSNHAAAPPQPDVASTLIQRLRAAPVHRRPEMVEEFVQSQVALVLGQQARTVSRTQGLTEMGLDSLASIELRTRLEQAFACRLPTTLAFDYPTVEALAAHVLQEILSGQFDDVGTTPEVVPPGEADLDNLSRDELAALLVSELGLSAEEELS
jgi:acyl carrier protein